MNAEEKRAYMVEYRVANRDRIRAISKRWREANAERRRQWHEAWRRSPAGIESERRQRERNRAAGAKQARAAVTRAIASGRLVRQPCAECGVEPAEAHHPRGYLGEARWDIEWLCRAHHEVAHHGVIASL